MKYRSAVVVLLASWWLIIPSVEASSVFKCTEGGVTSFQSLPCKTGKTEYHEIDIQNVIDADVPDYGRKRHYSSNKSKIHNPNDNKKRKKNNYWCDNAKRDLERHRSRARSGYNEGSSSYLLKREKELKKRVKDACG